MFPSKDTYAGGDGFPEDPTDSAGAGAAQLITYGHLEKFLSPSRHESDSMTVRGHGRMERAGHGAEGLFRC
jgi:hypothetical protein